MTETIPAKKIDTDNVTINADGVEVKVKNTTCYMCACRCGIRVTLHNGEVRYIQGNPDHPLNNGKICAKGSSGIMKQYSPARLTKPLLRKPDTERGQAEFETIEWEQVFDILEKRLGDIRKTDPKKFALFTGRDQMQALTGLFARNYGTPNYAAHGGFCSVNMAAGMIYTIGGSFWEFGGPDLDHAKLFIMIGTAEDHHSNPMKTALTRFKRNGGKFIAINPIRTGYAAIADQWIPIKPGTDGALLQALIRELILTNNIDHDFLIQHSNGADLVNQNKDSNDFGLFVRDEDKSALWWDSKTDQTVLSGSENVEASLFGEYTTEAGVSCKTSMQLLKEQVDHCTMEWAADITGISAETIKQLAVDMVSMAFDNAFELPISWTDTKGKTRDHVIGRPVAFHSMRGLAAHSNGFQSIRSLSILMSILGTIDRPGGFRHKAPFPKPIPPSLRTPNSPEGVQPNTPLAGTPLGFLTGPEDLFVDENNQPVRIDKAFSWEHPLSLHGMMQNTITNAWRGDPYPIDTLMLFMANMAWNSSMNTSGVREMLVDKNENGEYKIPFLVVCDAFQSETTAFADLIIPDTTYLERHDVMSILDRPISEFDGPVDSVRIPVLDPPAGCKPFQDVLIELGTRLKLPVFVHEDGTAKYKDYQDFVINYETAPGSGVGFLSGFRGKNGDKSMKGEPNPNQWQQYADNNCVHQFRLPESQQYMRNWNKDYLEWAKDSALIGHADPINIHIYSEILQKFRLAAQGKTDGRQPPDNLRKRVETYFDPLPFYYKPLEETLTDNKIYNLNALTQRPMAMYHSWDSQNAWLRQIHAHNYLYLNPLVGKQEEFEDGGWIWVESMHGKVRCMCRFSEAVEPGTVWTWNAIGKATGHWGLSDDANESKKGFLLNHLISEELPAHEAGKHLSNSDPITGQAAWYDVKVRVYKAEDQELNETYPIFDSVKEMPGRLWKANKWQQYFAGKGNYKKDPEH